MTRTLIAKRQLNDVEVAIFSDGSAEIASAPLGGTPEDDAIVLLALLGREVIQQQLYERLYIKAVKAAEPLRHQPFAGFIALRPTDDITSDGVSKLIAWVEASDEAEKVRAIRDRLGKG